MQEIQMKQPIDLLKEYKRKWRMYFELEKVYLVWCLFYQYPTTPRKYIKQVPELKEEKYSHMFFMLICSCV